MQKGVERERKRFDLGTRNRNCPKTRLLSKLQRKSAMKFGELKIAIIHAVVEKNGEDAAREVLNETLGVEAKGGMMTADNSKQRTPEGVFFVL